MKSLYKSTLLATFGIDDNVKAAIIGFWRSGATVDEIMEIVRLKYMVVQQIILDYEKGL